MLNRRRLSSEQEVVQGPDDYRALLLIKAVRSEELSETVERGVEEGRGI